MAERFRQLPYPNDVEGSNVSQFVLWEIQKKRRKTAKTLNRTAMGNVDVSDTIQLRNIITVVNLH